MYLLNGLFLYHYRISFNLIMKKHLICTNVVCLRRFGILNWTISFREWCIHSVLGASFRQFEWSLRDLLGRLVDRAHHDCPEPEMSEVDWRMFWGTYASIFGFQKVLKRNPWEGTIRNRIRSTWVPLRLFTDRGETVFVGCKDTGLLLVVITFRYLTESRRARQREMDFEVLGYNLGVTT